MRRAGLVVADTLALLERECLAGVTTLSLDALAEDSIRSAGAVPSFPDVPGYHHTLCVSVNDEVVHGIPGGRVLRAGDLVSIDCGAVVSGWHGDAAVTVVVGGREAASEKDLALVDATEASLWAGIAAFRVGGRIGDIGAAVEDSIAASSRRGTPGAERLGIVREYEGHGIGREMHMPPGVPNHRTRDPGPRVFAGATVAIEPMITLGSPVTEELDDDWTVVTLDGSRAAHWEHTVAVTNAGPWVLTSHDGGAERLAALGVQAAPLE